jgi:hypothetical protein
MRFLKVAVALTVVSSAARAEPRTESWIDVRAYDTYRCVTSWTAVCATDVFAIHRIELTGDKGMYHCAWGLDEPITLSGTTTKVQGFAMTIRRNGDQLDVKGPNLCFTGDPWEKTVSEGNVTTDTYRFVPLADFEAMRKRALAIVPGHACPKQLVAATADPKPICLFRATPPPPPHK